MPPVQEKFNLETLGFASLSLARLLDNPAAAPFLCRIDDQYIFRIPMLSDDEAPIVVREFLKQPSARPDVEYRKHADTFYAAISVDFASLGKYALSESNQPSVPGIGDGGPVAGRRPNRLPCLPDNAVVLSSNREALIARVTRELEGCVSIGAKLWRQCQEPFLLLASVNGQVDLRVEHDAEQRRGNFAVYPMSALAEAVDARNDAPGAEVQIGRKIIDVRTPTAFEGDWMTALQLMAPNIATASHARISSAFWRIKLSRATGDTSVFANDLLSMLETSVAGVYPLARRALNTVVERATKRTLPSDGLIEVPVAYGCNVRLGRSPNVFRRIECASTPVRLATLADDPVECLRVRSACGARVVAYALMNGRFYRRIEGETPIQALASSLGRSEDRLALPTFPNEPISRFDPDDPRCKVVANDCEGAQAEIAALARRMVSSPSGAWVECGEPVLELVETIDDDRIPVRRLRVVPSYSVTVWSRTYPMRPVGAAESYASADNSKRLMVDDAVILRLDDLSIGPRECLIGIAAELARLPPVPGRAEVAGGDLAVAGSMNSLFGDQDRTKMPDEVRGVLDLSDGGDDQITHWLRSSCIFDGVRSGKIGAAVDHWRRLRAIYGPWGGLSAEDAEVLSASF